MKEELRRLLSKIKDSEQFASRLERLIRDVCDEENVEVFNEGFKSITRHVCYSVFCDGCLAKKLLTADTQHEVEDFLRHCGWRKGEDELWLCPACLGRLLKNEGKSRDD